MSQSYAATATQLCEGHFDDVNRLPFFMLVAHALELSFKAVLSYAGRDEERLMSIGHNLRLCFDLARKEGGFWPIDTPDLEVLVDALAAPHSLEVVPFFWTG